MNRRQNHLERGREERHGVFADSGALREVIGLSAKRSTYCFFGNRGGNDGLDAARKRLVACGIKIGDRAGAGLSAEFAPFDRRDVSVQVAYEENTFVGDVGRIVDPTMLDGKA